MEVSKQQMQKILTSKCTFTQLGLNMLVTRLVGIYSNNPTDAVLMQCVNEINAFISKYRAIMEKDFETISKL